MQVSEACVARRLFNCENSKFIIVNSLLLGESCSGVGNKLLKPFVNILVQRLAFL